MERTKPGRKSDTLNVGATKTLDGYESNALRADDKYQGHNLLVRRHVKSANYGLPDTKVSALGGGDRLSLRATTGALVDSEIDQAKFPNRGYQANSPCVEAIGGIIGVQLDERSMVIESQ